MYALYCCGERVLQPLWELPERRFCAFETGYLAVI
jgi:hypothetical protein